MTRRPARHRDELTPRQEALARAWVANGCKGLVECARMAGYPGKDKVLKSTASRMLRGRLRGFVEQLKLQVAQRIDIRAVRIQAEVAALAFSNIADCVQDDGSVRPLREIPAHAQRAIQEYKIIETEAGVITSLRLHAKLPALEMLAKMKGLVKPDESRNVTAALEFFNDKAPQT